MRIDSGYVVNDIKLFYELKEDGFYIYEGENAKFPAFHQYEPYIPNPDIGYKENALQMCKELDESFKYVPAETFVMTEEMYNKQQSDIDYLMLLSDGGIV